MRSKKAVRVSSPNNSPINTKVLLNFFQKIARVEGVKPSSPTAVGETPLARRHIPRAARAVAERPTRRRNITFLKRYPIQTSHRRANFAKVEAYKCVGLKKFLSADGPNFANAKTEFFRGFVLFLTATKILIFYLKNN